MKIRFRHKRTGAHPLLLFYNHVGMRSRALTLGDIIKVTRRSDLDGTVSLSDQMAWSPPMKEAGRPMFRFREMSKRECVGRSSFFVFRTFKQNRLELSMANIVAKV